MITKPKGTYDVFNNENLKWEHLIKTISEVFSNYNYDYIRTPIFESTSLFKRENEFSEMVKKQTYDFIDKGSRKQTLRPEGTAGVIRAVIENKLYVDKNSKFYYFGPYFRYERPQKGRYREFFQFGVEALGEENYLLDSEIIILATRILDRLNLKYEVRINTLGDDETKQVYDKKLKNYFKKNISNLCTDCQERLENNPLRILDCKIDSPKTEVQNAPIITDYLSKEASNIFSKIEKILKQEKINFKKDPKIVRGLDYYTGLVFEIITPDNVVLAGGGRYQNLVKELGGPDIGGVGFAFGCERVLNQLPNMEKEKPVFYILSDIDRQDYAFSVLEKLRKNNIKTMYDFKNRNFSKKLKEALSYNPEFLIFIKEDEQKNKTLTIKNTKTEKQENINFSDLLKFKEANHASKK